MCCLKLVGAGGTSPNKELGPGDQLELLSPLYFFPLPSPPWTKRGLRAQTRPVGSVRARPLVSVRARHITLVYSLVFEHVTLHWYTL